MNGHHMTSRLVQGGAERHSIGQYTTQGVGIEFEFLGSEN